VPEQSHKREMDAAVRGDFARLRRRGVTTTLGAPSPAQHAGAETEEPAETTAEAEIEEPRRSLLERVFGRP
jgi:hypothetical protein